MKDAGACFVVQAACGCNDDCCAGTVCDQVGGLVQTMCCKEANAECAEHSDCCGQLLCKPDGTKMTCQPL